MKRFLAFLLVATAAALGGCMTSNGAYYGPGYAYGGDPPQYRPATN